MTRHEHCAARKGYILSRSDAHGMVARQGWETMAIQ